MTAPERIYMKPNDMYENGWARPIDTDQFDEEATEYIRADLAAVHTAQVRVKPLVWGWNEGLRGWRADCELTRDVFCVYETNAGWVASSQTTGATIHANADAAKSALDSYRAASILAALEPQPDPRDEVIARLVEALGECRQAITDYMNQYPHMAKGYLVDAEQHARAALAAAKAVQSD